MRPRFVPTPPTDAKPEIDPKGNGPSRQSSKAAFSPGSVSSTRRLKIIK